MACMLGKVLTAIPQGVLILDKDHIITYANSAFEAMTGYSMAETMGLGWELLLGVESDDATRKAIASALRVPEPFHGEILNYRRDGSTFWTDLSIRRINNAKGEAVLFVAVLTDITARKRDEDVLRELSRRIEAQSRDRVSTQEKMHRRLAAELHDRTSSNLAAISINLVVMAEALAWNGPAEIRDRLEDTQALIEDTAANIRDISAELRPAMLDHAGLLPAMESYASSFRRRSGIALSIFPPEQTLQLDGSLDSYLFRIFREALTNVAKHARATHVEVHIAQDKGGLLLSIRDDGVGFDTGDSSSASSGCRLGLITMREQVEYAGGSLVLQSRPGDGTRIQVWLPTFAWPE